MRERWIKIIAILLMFLMNLASGWMFENADYATVALRILATLISITLEWELAHILIKHGRKVYPKLAQVRKRVVYTAAFFFMQAIAIQLLTEFVVDNVIDSGLFLKDPFRIVVILLQALQFTFTTIGLFEAVYYYSNYSKAETEKEELRRANLESQLNSLKDQVNPHFLFNSLNTLSSLISMDAERAELFVEEMSNVYRFLLRSNQQPLISLSDEIDFIKSYLHLLTTRFGDNLKVSICIDEQYGCYLLPPLTLQLLVENVIKHNIISQEAPLFLTIFTTQSDRLHVENNLQKKTRQVLSEKVGLSNIIDKYRILRQADVEIKETFTHFTVSIPLISAEPYANINYRR